MLGNFSAAGSRGVALPSPRVAYFARNARPLGASQSCGAQGCRTRQRAASDATQAQPGRRPPGRPLPPGRPIEVTGSPSGPKYPGVGHLAPWSPRSPKAAASNSNGKISRRGGKGPGGVRWRPAVCSGVAGPHAVMASPSSVPRAPEKAARVLDLTRRGALLPRARAPRSGWA